jgi:UDP-GlcNAc:undecaprenyl-phosphate/decaprenyl-phosphate GlcNAc-1-phosphate transferase
LPILTPVSIQPTEYLLLGIAGFLLAGFLTWPVRKVAISIGAMDQPNLERKTQKEPVPYLGGLAIAISVVVLTFAAVIRSDNTQTTFPLAATLLFPAIFLGLMGLIDDLASLNPLPRLIIQTVMAIAVAIFLIRSDTVGITLDGTFLDEVVMTIWIIGICNSINFFDNLDGGAAGTVAVSTIGIALIALGEGQELIAALSIVTAGSTIGFLMWNKSPAKIYMGDAGALFLGVVVSVLTIRLNPGIAPKWNSISLLPMLLAIPILDTCVAVFSRIDRGISPFTGGKDHLSHRLMRKGLSKQGTAFALWGAQAVFVGCALAVYQFTAAFGTPLIVAAGLVWLAAFVWFWRIPSTD